jgi:ProQ/FINO family
MAENRGVTTTIQYSGAAQPMSIGDSLEPGDPVPVLGAGSEPNRSVFGWSSGEKVAESNTWRQRHSGEASAVLSEAIRARAGARDEAARRHGPLNTISRRLFAAFPRAFKYPPVPLAVGIGRELCHLMSPEFKPAEIRVFLHAWTSGPRYLKAVVRGEMRRNLDGSPAGVPEAEHRTAARQQLRAMGHSPLPS